MLQGRANPALFESVLESRGASLPESYKGVSAEAGGSLTTMAEAFQCGACTDAVSVCAEVDCCYFPVRFLLEMVDTFPTGSELRAGFLL